MNYIVRDEAVIVDEFTGRVMPGRRWVMDNQAIEAMRAFRSSLKPNVGVDHLPELSAVSASGGHDRHGQDRRSGIREDLQARNQIVPTNRVRARQDWADQVYKTEVAKWRAVANETAEIHKKGRPVLVGTTSVRK